MLFDPWNPSYKAVTKANWGKVTSNTALGVWMLFYDFKNKTPFFSFPIFPWGYFLLSLHNYGSRGNQGQTSSLRGYKCVWIHVSGTWRELCVTYLFVPQSFLPGPHPPGLQNSPRRHSLCRQPYLPVWMEVMCYQSNSNEKKNNDTNTVYDYIKFWVRNVETLHCSHAKKSRVFFHSSPQLRISFYGTKSQVFVM